MDQPSDSIAKVDKIWEELLIAFSNWKMVKPKKSWLQSGMPNRINHHRMMRLKNSSMAKTFFKTTKDFSDDEFKYLHTLTKLNLEQVTPAARLTMIMNVTVIIGLFVILNQALPGYLAEILGRFFDGNYANSHERGLTYAAIFGLLSFIPFASGVTLYYYGGIAGARDLKNLTEFSMGRRGIGNQEAVSDVLLEKTL